MIRGGGEPTSCLATVPFLRMDPPPRSHVADAYDRIMVTIQRDQPDTSLRQHDRRATTGSPQIIHKHKTQTATHD